MNIAQYLSLVLSLVTLGLAIFRIKKNPKDRYAVYPVIFLMVHLFLFYLYVFSYRNEIISPCGISNTWSSILRLHELFTFLLYQVSALTRKNIQNNKHDLSKEI
jgi:hypothetical protein